MGANRVMGCALVGLLVLAPLARSEGVAASSRPSSAPHAKQLDDNQVRAAVAKHLAAQAESVGLSKADVLDFEITDIVRDPSGLIHVYVKQQIGGIGIFNAVSSVTLNPDGSLVYLGNAFLSNAAQRVAGATSPKVGPVDALRSAALALDLAVTETPVVEQAPRGVDSELVLSDGGDVSTASIPARLEYDLVDGKHLRLGWSLTIDAPGTDSWIIHIDATSGAELSRTSLVVYDAAPDSASSRAAATAAPTAAAEAPATAGGSTSFTAPPSPVNDGSSYSVFAPPIEAPSFGARETVNTPADSAGSPFGWHDTNGVAGAESTKTIGNNVTAYTDTNDDNVLDPGSQPDGGASLDFIPALDLNQDPSAYRPAAVTNLFFVNNYVHDVLSRYGFTAAAGNFQTNNYAQGGLSGDAVRAEAQDGSGLNNANFSTPVDGLPPRMQMYVFSGPTPDRDGDLDNDIIIHEYGHGVSARLTGGPSVVTCLNNDEQPGEGWSDFFGYMLTQDWSLPFPASRGIGTYVLNEPTNGPGIRSYRYSTSLATNPQTYDTIKDALDVIHNRVEPHEVGEVWAEMLWEMTAALVGRYGSSPNMYTGTAGNNRAIQLVMDGMKLQPCSPGFVDARDAILAAANLAPYNGVDTCLIWTAFAKRGLGFSATQGSSASYTDGVEAFDMPPSCTYFDLTASAATAAAGSTVTYTTRSLNSTGSASTANVVTVPIPAGTAYVAGSATCPATSDASTLTMTPGTIAAGATKVCTFALRMPFTGSSTTFADGFDAGAANWSTPVNAGLQWALSSTTPRSAPNEMFGSEPAFVTDQRLALLTPVVIPTAGAFQFWQERNLESTFDGGVVEYCLSAGGNCADVGAGWIDAGPLMTEHGYNARIDTIYDSPIGGRYAFSGLSTYQRTTLNLASLVGQSVLFRFRLGSDNDVGASGWSIDDVSLRSVRTVPVTATRTDGIGGTSSLTNTVELDDGSVTTPGAPLALSGTGGNGSVALAWTAPASNGGAPITDYLIDVSSNGGASWSPFSDGVSTSTSTSVTGLADATAYSFRVFAVNAVGTGPTSNSASATTAPPPKPPAIFTALSPVRIFDTRPDQPQGVVAVEQHKYGGVVELRVKVTGVAGVPGSGVGAVSLNVTAVDPSGGGYVTVYPCGDRPNASNLNYVTGDVVPNAVIAPVSPDGEVCFYSLVDTHLLADVNGWFTASAGFHPLSPVRVFDSRPDQPQGAVAIEQHKYGGVVELKVKVAGVAGVPASGVGAVSLNVTAVDPNGGGYVTVYPCGDRPNASNLNYVTGDVVPNAVIAPVSPDGEVCFYSLVDTHLLADVNGWFASGTGFTSLSPVRVFDSRPDQPQGAVAIEQHKYGGVVELKVKVTGVAGVPASGVGAVSLNVTAVDPIGGGYVTVYPCGDRPNASNLNYVAGDVVPNAVIAPVSAAGEVCFYSLVDTHLLADVNGWFAS